MGFPYSHEPVPESNELVRICGLPRRKLEVRAYHRRFASALYVPDAPRKYRLRDAQVLALYELSRCKGLVGRLGVGCGKTAVGLLAGSVTGSRRVVILCPTALRANYLIEWEKCGAEFGIPRPSLDYRAPAGITVVGYERLQTSACVRLLDELDPDLIVADECHYLRNTKSARASRVWQRIKSRGTPFVGMSGTLITHTLRGAPRIFYAALREGSPLPKTYQDAEDWVEATEPGTWRPPGALVERLCHHGESVLEGIQKRIAETQGVVSMDSGDCPSSMYCSLVDTPIPQSVRAAVAELDLTWSYEDVAPTSALHYQQLAQQLALGFYYRLQFARPEDSARWRDARRLWQGACRDVIRRQACRGIDSPLRVALAAEASPDRFPDTLEALAAWRSADEECRPTQHTVWLDAYAARFAAEWGAVRPGIIWVPFRAMGEELAKRGIPFYDSADDLLTLYREKGDRSVALSLRAFAEGANLQMFNRALYLGSPTSSKQLQQSMARIHRPGQTSDECTYDFFLPGIGPRVFSNVCSKAYRTVRLTQEEQKILIADCEPNLAILRDLATDDSLTSDE